MTYLIKREITSCEAKSCSCTYCASKDFNEADCDFSFYPTGKL